MESLKLNNKETLRRKIFVEIGTNNLSIPRIGKKEFDDNELYVGIDKSFKDTKKSSEWKSAENINFLTTNAKRLPFEDASVDTVFIGNVLGDPSVSEEDKSLFIEEAKRVIRQGGDIIIKENSTPAFFSHFPNRREYLNYFVQEHDLTVYKFVDVNSPDWNEIIKQYDSMSNPSNSSGAFITFLKV